jgi:glycerol-3-phosphate dehydrogenase (NAD(P)+)
VTTLPAVCVLGAGNWGTTLAHIVARNDRVVRLWTNDPRQRDEINEHRTNAQFAPGLTIDSGVRSSTDLAESISDAEPVLIAIPSQAFREVCRQVGNYLVPEQVVIHGTKGLEVGTHRRMSQILQDETCARQVGVLAGPNVAPEVAAGKPTGTVIASPFPRVVEVGRRALSSSRLMVFAGTDVLGVELAGALKNVVAIAAGMADEMDVGDNAKAFLMTRGMTELMRLASAMGAEPMTLTGLAGIGDLIVTCQSRLSRNHRIGVALARGEKLDEAVARLGMVAEGVYASSAARDLARQHHIDMPLFERIDRVLHEGLAPREAIAELMQLVPGRDVPSPSRPQGLSGNRGPTPGVGTS